MGPGVQGLALLSGRICCVILGKSQTLSELPWPQWQYLICGEAPGNSLLYMAKNPLP